MSIDNRNVMPPLLLEMSGAARGSSCGGFELRGFELMLLLLQDVISSQGVYLVANKGTGGIADSYLNIVAAEALVIIQIGGKTGPLA